MKAQEITPQQSACPDEDDRARLLEAAAYMAAELLEHDKVLDVQLVEVPVSDPSDPPAHAYRVLVIVDDELVKQYAKRTLEPASVTLEDADNNGNTWVYDDTETSTELPFHLLGMTPEGFFGRVDSAHGVCMEDVSALFDFILLPRDWTKLAGTQLERFYKSADGTEYPPFFPEGEGHYTLKNHMTFDSTAGTFTMCEWPPSPR